MKFIRSHILLLVFALVVGVAFSGGASTVFGQDPKPDVDKTERDDDDENESPKHQMKLAKKAKISRERAREIALERVPGEVIEEEIEKEHGKLVWSFDIRDKDAKIFEVVVVANSGEILEVEEETEEDSDDPDGEDISRKRSFFEKAVGGVRSTTGKVFRKMTGN